MTDGALAPLKRSLRRYRCLILAIAVVHIIVYMPLVPYSPECDDPEPTVVGSIFLAKDFQETLIENFQYWGVPYLSIGNVVLLRFWTWLVDPGGWVGKASGDSVYHFIDERYGAEMKTVPPHVIRTIESYRGTYGFVDRRCDLVRAVAIEGW